MSKNIDTESPDIQLDVGQMFDIDVDMKVPGFSEQYKELIGFCSQR